jgi:hypothetical protein
MKNCYSPLFAAILCVFLAISTGVSASADSFSLNDGSQIKGRVMSATASEVTMMTDFGLIRIALEKLTPESRAKITDGTKPDLDAEADGRGAGGAGAAAGEDPRPEAGHEADNSHREDAVDLARETY